MANFILTMGIPKQGSAKLQEGFRFDGAIIQLINWETKEVIKEISYKPPPQHLPPGLSVQFKGAHLSGKDLYVVTNTEILKYDISNWSLEKVISHPTFNDLHAVLYKDGYIYVCNTGLEMVQVIDSGGAILQEINLATDETWKRFDRCLDYRTIPTTKPHEAHINHLFELDGEIWVTRGHKGDAVCLNNKEKTFKIRSQDSQEIIICHDGRISGDSIYFTAVDGRVFKLSTLNGKRQMKYDLNSAIQYRKRVPWTRGIEVLDRFAFVGLTKMRTTKYRELASWALKGRPIKMPSGVAQLDMLSKKIVDFYQIKKHSGAAIYSIISLDEGLKFAT